MKKTIALLLALLLVGSGLSVFASDPLKEYTVYLKGNVAEGEGVEDPTDPEGPGDKPDSIEYKGLKIKVGRSVSRLSLGAEYLDDNVLRSLGNYSSADAAIVADMTGNSSVQGAVDEVYFYVAAAASTGGDAPALQIDFSSGTGWAYTAPTGSSATHDAIPIDLTPAVFSGGKATEDDYNVTATVVGEGDSADNSAAIKVSTGEYKQSLTWRYLGEVVADWEQSPEYSVGDYAAQITVTVSVSA